MPWHENNKNTSNLPAQEQVNPQNPTAPAVKPLAHTPSYGYMTTQKERPLREYVAIVIHYRYLIILLTVLGACVGYFQNKKITTMYTAEALVSIGSYVPPTDGPVATALHNESIDSDYIKNLLHTIMSYRIAQYIYINNERIWNHFNPGVPHIKSDAAESSTFSTDNNLTQPKLLVDEALAARIPVPALEAYLQRISFTQVEAGSMIRIYAKARDPELAAYFANTHAKAFIEFVREKRLQSALINVNFMNKRVEELSQKAAEAKEKMLKFAQENNLSLGNSQNSDGSNMVSIVTGLSQSTTERAILDQEVRELKSGNSINSMNLGADAMPLVSKITDLESQYSALYAVNRRHPELKFIRTQIENIKKTLKFSADQIRKESELKRNAAKAKETLLRTELERLKGNESNQAQNQFQYSMLENEYKTINETLTQVRRRLEDATVQAESDQQTAQVIDAAIPPMVPSVAPRQSNILTTALIGLFVGIGLAFLIDSQDGSIRTITDLKQTLELPVLGVIPAFSKRLISFRSAANEISSDTDSDEFEIAELIIPDATQPFTEAINNLYSNSIDEEDNGEVIVHKDNHPVVIISAPFSREAEAFRNLRTTMMFSRSGAQPRRILFTSAEKGVGKTTVAVNVAASIAQIGAKVILIDTDLRMPTTHEHFGLGRSRLGLSDYLEGKARLPDIITESGISDLSLILAGSQCASPSELLSSQPMLSLLDELSKQFDFVILDTPPVGEIADALLLSHSADGVILVIRSGLTLKNSAKMAFTRLTQVKAHMLGVAFNGVRSLDTYREGYHYYSQYSGYGYHSYHAPPKETKKFNKDKQISIEDNLSA